MCCFYIREAVLNDVSVIANLTEQLGYTTSLSTLHANILSYLQVDERSLFVAVANDIVVGYIASDMAQTFHREGKHMKVVSLVVDQSQRGKGIGKGLLQAAENWAMKHKCWMVELTSSFRRQNEGTHDFYLNQGYQKTGSQYFRKLMEYSYE